MHVREVLVKTGSCHRSVSSLSGSLGMLELIFPGDKLPLWLPQCPSPSREFLEKFSFLWGNGFHNLIVSLEYLHSARPAMRELRADQKGVIGRSKGLPGGKNIN